MYQMDNHALREADVTSLAKSAWASERCIDSLVVVLAGALRDVDVYTAEHSADTVALATRVAQVLSVPAPQVRVVAQVAALHDIGKIGVPMELLLKPGPLTADETRTMRTHPVVGERILAGIPELAKVATAIRHEHERWDGRGYPDGLAGEAIPLPSRIVFACDAWHAMISDRPYQPPMHPDSALRELETNAGSQFDPTVTQALIGVLRQELSAAA